MLMQFLGGGGGAGRRFKRDVFGQSENGEWCRNFRSVWFPGRDGIKMEGDNNKIAI